MSNYLQILQLERMKKPVNKSPWEEPIAIAPNKKSFHEPKMGGTFRIAKEIQAIRSFPAMRRGFHTLPLVAQPVLGGLLFACEILPKRALNNGLATYQDSPPPGSH